ncbi:DUF6177 family protein [Streptomonospora nanhaiensis]|uniref:Uncharacterized protein n=1 Tax=Streptomonospora nanhaiensis TaxID=1323731 RepID=A0A853BP97_9ACTN|nr:DUF6177 family protein [Streptomonospora nanhaiensis]MBV2362287.1 hypothetical protein [Streptomonospora nanhaiensis]NYI97268.1 hypothetical protein [Streptomonospora nanhaiensis]
MTHDVVALLENRPTMRGMTRALVHADPGARVRTVAEGAVVEMRDDSGRLLAAAQAGQRLSGLDEVRRLLGGGDAVVWRSGAGTDPARTPLPERPWWVEARGGELGADGTGTGNDADTDTADMARRFAAALVAQFGGYIWEAKPRLRRDDPLLLGTTDHPAVSLSTERVAVAVQDRPVVPLSPWIIDAVAGQGREQRAFQLVTPPEARLTHELAALLQNPMARWVVRASDGTYYDGLFGAPLVWHQDAGFVRDPERASDRAVHPLFRRKDDTLVDHLVLDLKMLHPADSELRVGGEVELLAGALAGSAPALWGTSEPAPLVWDREKLTELVRKRAPRGSRVVFLGPHGGARPFSGSLRVERVAEGVKESVTLAVAYPAGTEPGLSAVRGLVEELGTGGSLQSLNVHRRRGRADLTRAASYSGALVPVGLALGAEGVHRVGGLDHATAAPVPPVRIGPRLTPTLWYAIGDGTDPGARRQLRGLISHLRPKKTESAD